jgi:outer membrane protein
MKKFTLVMVFVFGLCAASAFAADKFGYVSMEKIADAYSKAKEYSKVLDDKEAGYTAEIDKKKDELKAAQDKLNLLSDKEKEAKSAEFEAKFKSFQEFVRAKQSDLRKEGVEKTIEISKDIKNAITVYSEKEGFTMVFDAAALAYQPKSMDITDKIIEILNNGAKK